MAVDPSELSPAVIVAALRATDQNIGQAARDLGIDRRTLMRRMRVLKMPKGRPGRRYKPLHRRGKGRQYLPALGIAAAAALGVAALVKKGTST